ncbi:MAG: CRTAC1 family protein, partial [Herbaspirillum sp.]|uniref:CRTAC1 family protein n=1 Tax=Herbaspirillum sp. TaxID=1890675 RepID=UPI002590ABA2
GSAVSSVSSSSSGGSWGDADNDGDLDLLVTSGGGSNRFYENLGGGSFESVSIDGLTTDSATFRGSCWFDCDNDGDLDVFVTAREEDNFLYRNNGGLRFTKIPFETPNSQVGDTIGLTAADYDGDGFLDLYMVNFNDPGGEANFMYRNNGNSNNWLRVPAVTAPRRLTGQSTDSNPGTWIGARVRVKAVINGQAVWQTREIPGLSGAYGQSDLSAHFGLGD